jgi:hypothetical protein
MFAGKVSDQPGDRLEKMKNDIIKYDAALQYLTKFKIIPEEPKAAKELRDVIARQGWEKKK